MIGQFIRNRVLRLRSARAILCGPRPQSISIGNEVSRIPVPRASTWREADSRRVPQMLRTLSAFLMALNCLLSFTSSARAEERWTLALKIPEVLVDDTYTTAIVAGVDNPASCNVPSFLRIAKTESNYESITATILSAQAQGRMVRFFAAVCYPDGSVHITGVWIQQQ